MPVQRDDIRRAVRNFLLTEFLAGDKESELRDDTPLISGGILDSIATVRMVVHLEERYGIKIPAAAVTVQHFDSVNQVIDLVAELGLEIEDA